MLNQSLMLSPHEDDLERPSSSPSYNHYILHNSSQADALMRYILAAHRRAARRGFSAGKRQQGENFTLSISRIMANGGKQMPCARGLQKKLLRQKLAQSRKC